LSAVIAAKPSGMFRRPNGSSPDAGIADADRYGLLVDDIRHGPSSVVILVSWSASVPSTFVRSVKA
jgi:hypothetical protein